MALHERFVMCSTVKASIARASFPQVDQGSIRLDDPIRFDAADVDGWYAPVAKENLAEECCRLTRCARPRALLSAVETGATFRSTVRKSDPFDTPCSRQPDQVWTWSPTVKAGLLLCSITATVGPGMAAPTSIVGSSDEPYP